MSIIKNKLNIGLMLDLYILLMLKYKVMYYSLLSIVFVAWWILY